MEPIMRDVFVCFYSFNHSDNSLIVSNGFSFEDGQLSERPEHIWIDRLNPMPEIEADRIFCSATFLSDLIKIGRVVDDRWTIGGPAVDYLSGFGSSKYFKPGPIGPRSFFSPFKVTWDELRQRFNPDITYFSASLGEGCYWNKCEFCSHKFLHKGASVRSRDPYRLIEEIPENESFAADVCKDTLSVSELKAICGRKNRKTLILTFLRADKHIVSAIKNCPDLTRTVFVIGTETPSQTIRDIIGKGQSDEDILELSEIICSRGGIVNMTQMSRYGCITQKCVDEAYVFIDKLASIANKYSTQITCSGYYPTGWYTRESAERVSGGLPVIEQTKEVFGIEIKRYYVEIMRDKEEDRLNNMIIDRLRTTDLFSRQITPGIKQLPAWLYEIPDVTTNGGIAYITIQKGHTLSSTLGSAWRDIYSSSLNSDFRQLRPDPDKVKAGDVIKLHI